MIRVILIGVLLISGLIPGLCQGDLSDGFYLTVDCDVRPEISRKSILDSRRVLCLAQQPFLSMREVDDVSSVINADRAYYFDINISKKGADKLRKIKASLKNATIALIVNNEMVFIIEDKMTIQHILRILVFSSAEDLAAVREQIIKHAALAKASPEG
jgi:hypothetical protein